jgi:hypothetical protein
LPSRAVASTIVHETLETVLKTTTVALVADVQKVGPVEKQGIWRELELSVKPVRILFGKLDDKAKAFSCRYSEGAPHTRGGTMVSPLVSGSGYEFQLKKGNRVIVLLSQQSADKPGKLLRIEPLSNLKLIPASRTASKTE